MRHEKTELAGRVRERREKSVKEMRTESVDRRAEEKNNSDETPDFLMSDERPYEIWSCIQRAFVTRQDTGGVFLQPASLPFPRRASWVLP